MRKVLIPLAAAVLLSLAWSGPAGSAPAGPGVRGVPGGNGGAATDTTLSYGPIPLPPATGDAPGYSGGFLPVVPMPCTDCYLTGTSIDLVYPDGTSANLDTGVMLHHVVVFNSGRPDATCAPDTPVGFMGERFFAAGNERTSGTLPAGFGYHLGHDPVRGVLEIMNHSPEAKTVYLKTTVSHVPDSEPGMKAVTPVWMDENNCGTSQYSAPAGQSNQVARWTSNLTGRIIAAGGHVHDGGLRTVLANETTGEHLCASHAGYGTKPAYAGSVESMTTCIWDRLGTVRKGEVLAIDTHYNLAEARSDVMGIMLAYVYETDDLAGGTPAPPEPSAPPAATVPPGGHHHH
jgi:hypothetical protein